MLQSCTDDLEVQRRERGIRKGGYVLGFMKEVLKFGEKPCSRDSQRSDVEGKRFRKNGLFQLDESLPWWLRW